MKNVWFLLLSVWFGFSAVAAAEETSGLNSPTAASALSQLAMEIYYSDPLNPAAVEQAMALLEAALSLNANATEIQENVLRVGAAGQISPQDFSPEVRTALRQYVDQRANLSVAQEAAAYLVDRLNSRPEREELLGRLIYYFEGRNPAFVSGLMTYLSLLTVERGDFTTARSYLSQALQLDPYNRRAFTQFLDLSARTEEGVSPAALAVQFRRMLTANPYDLNSAVVLAEHLKQYEVYGIAADAYAYSAALLGYLEPDRKLPEAIYQPWIFMCLRSDKQVAKCDEIARRVRESGRLDLTVEAAAGLAAQKLGQAEKAGRIWQYAAAQAEEQLKGGEANPSVSPEQLSWFYGFVLDEPEKALAWAHEAYSLRPESDEVLALFAYALVLNDQGDVAEEYLTRMRTPTPVARMAKARILHQADQSGQAIELLKQVAGEESYTVVGSQAIQQLREMGSDYFPQVPPETVVSALTSQFGEPIIPELRPAEEKLEAKINLGGSQYLYGGDLNARLIIENTGRQDLVIRDHAMFTGLVRIDAVVRGDLDMAIPGLLELQLVPGQAIQPGQYASLDVNLMTGKLREVLLTFPQADVEVEFTMWLDPIQVPEGGWQNRLKGLSPVRQVISRKGIVIDSEFLIQRLDILSNGSEGQKARVATLFAGLLAEQAAARRQGLPYAYIRVEPKVMADALKRLLKDENWKIQLQTLAAIAQVSISADSNLLQTVSSLLSSEQWPVRLGAMLVMSRFESQNFEAVLEWQAKNDLSPINQQMAKALMED